MTPADRRRLEALAAKARRRGLAPAPRPPRRLAWGERVRLAMTGLGRLWASRRPWARLELEAARQAERDGRRRLLAAWWGAWDQVGPQRSTLGPGGPRG